MVKRGEPELGTGANQLSEWMPPLHHPDSSNPHRPRREPHRDWRRSCGSHGSEQTPWTRHGTNVLLGWRSHQGAHQGIGAALEPNGCLARFGSQPIIEEPGALPVDEWNALSTYRGKTARHALALLITAG